MTADRDTQAPVETVREALKQATAEHLRHHKLLPEWALPSSLALDALAARLVEAEAVAANYLPMAQQRDDLIGVLNEIIVGAREARDHIDDLEDTGAHVGYTRYEEARTSGKAWAALIARRALARIGHPQECGARSWQHEGHAICRGPWGHDGGHIWEVQ